MPVIAWFLRVFKLVMCRKKEIFDRCFKGKRVGSQI